MKLISMWEPWATLYATGLKRIETRGWPTTYQGWLAVHATKGGLSRAQLVETCWSKEFYWAMQGRTHFHHGCIIGAVNVIACHPTHRRSWQQGIFDLFPELDTPRERAFGNYEPGRYGILADAKTFVLPAPIPFKSRQGKLIDLPKEIFQEMRHQWTELPEAHG